MDPASRVHSSVGMDNFLQKTVLVLVVLMVVGLFVLTGLRLGPGSDVSRSSPSRRELNFPIGLGKTDVRLGLVPHFAVGSIADVASPASPGGDPLMLWVGDVNGRLDVRGLDISDVGVTSPSSRVTVSVNGSVLKNGIDSVTRKDPVGTPPSFQAYLPVLRTARGRGRTHVAESASAERLNSLAATGDRAIVYFGIQLTVLTAAVMVWTGSFRAKGAGQLRFNVRDLFRE